MKKYFGIFTMILILLGCSSVDEEGKKMSFEERILEVMEDNEVAVDTIVDYDIKGNHIIVFYIMQGKILKMAIIEQTSERLKWVETTLEGKVATGVFAEEGTPFISIVRPRQGNEEYKEVRVFGKPAKLVTYYDNPAEGVTLEMKYWVAYTDKDPRGHIEKIKK